MEIKPLDFKESGLYLFFSNGSTLALTPRTIEERTHAILGNPKKMPPEILKAEAFQLCSVCPHHGNSNVTCHAIRPMLAFWENMDQYFSCDRVTAVYRGTEKEKLIVAETSLQYGLQYLSMLSLLHYCEVGKKYWKYFCGVHPLMESSDLVARVYLNMFWSCGGDREKARKLINTFHEEITITTRCQMDRIRLFCRHDPFLNALVITQIASEFLAINAEEFVRQHFKAFENSTPC